MNIETTNAPNTDEAAIGFIPCYRLPFLTLYQIDVLEGLKNIPDKSQDLIMVNGFQYLDQNNYNSLLTNLIIELNKL